MIINYPGDQYKAFTYPGGETQVRLNAPIALDVQSEAVAITVHARVHNAQELIEVLLLGDAIEQCKNFFVPLRLNIPYLPYARADRRFVDGDCSGLATFIAMLNGSEYDEVISVDVHNPKAVEAAMWHFTNVSAVQLIQRVIGKLCYNTNRNRITILYPDEGASKRYPDLKTGEHQVIYASKVRNPETGKLEGFSVPDDIHNDVVLVVDDICDGGGTFIGIAEALAKTDKFPRRLALYVTHGIFSKGLMDLAKWYDSIYTTNSFHQDLQLQFENYDGILRVWDAFNFEAMNV